MEIIPERYRASFEAVRTEAMGPVETWDDLFLDPSYAIEYENLPLAMHRNDYRFLSGLDPDERDRLILAYAVDTWQIIRRIGLAKASDAYNLFITLYDDSEDLADDRGVVDAPLFPKLGFAPKPALATATTATLHPPISPFGLRVARLLARVPVERPVIIREDESRPDLGLQIYIDFEPEPGERRVLIA